MKRQAWIFALMTMAAMTFATTLTAFANRRYSEREIREIARNNGYESGFREGREDRRDRRSFDFRRNHIFRDGMRGYREIFYFEDDYRQAFRQGFENGYRAGFYQGGNGWGWNNNFPGQNYRPWQNRWNWNNRRDCDLDERFGNRRRR